MKRGSARGFVWRYDESWGRADEAGIEGAEDQADVVQDGPGDFEPCGVVGIEFDFAMAVEAEEGVEARGEIAKGRQELLFDDFARRMIAKKLEESGSAENFFGKGVQFGIDHAGFGFAESEQGIVEARSVSGTDGENEEVVENAMEQGLRYGDGDVGLEIVGAEFANFLYVVPEGRDGLRLEGTSHEFANADEIAVEIAGPEEGEFLNPAVIFAHVRDSGFDIGERCEAERDAFEVEIDGVLVTVDVVMEHAEPFALKGREAHEAEGVGEGTMETVLDEIPGKRSDGGGKTFGGFVAGPARRDGGNGAGLQKEEFVAGEAPFDVLWEVVMRVDAEGEIAELGELAGGEGGCGGLVGS